MKLGRASCIKAARAVSFVGDSRAAARARL
jgi:hypothetical protein